MTKKIAKNEEDKTTDKFQIKTLNSTQLKALATKRVRQLQKQKRNSPKISKPYTQIIPTPKKTFKVQKQLFQEIIDQSVFQCPICLQLMIQPTLLQCGHAYCFKCIQELMIYKSNCGVCRNLQKEPQFQKSRYLQTLIEKVVLQKSQNFLDFYCRLGDVQNWKRVRNISINELSKGAFIDFRDKELKWRKAQIIKISMEQERNIYQMIVKYKKQGQTIQETINSESGRYTKFSYYTRMKYLQPKPSLQVLESTVNEQILHSPIPPSFRDLSEQLIQFQTQSNNETPFSNIQQNILLDESILPYFQQNQFLDQIFASNQPQPMEMFQILV